MYLLHRWGFSQENTYFKVHTDKNLTYSIKGFIHKSLLFTYTDYQKWIDPGNTFDHKSLLIEFGEELFGR